MVSQLVDKPKTCPLFHSFTQGGFSHSTPQGSSPFPCLRLSSAQEVLRAHRQSRTDLKSLMSYLASSISQALVLILPGMQQHSLQQAQGKPLQLLLQGGPTASVIGSGASAGNGGAGTGAGTGTAGASGAAPAAQLQETAVPSLQARPSELLAPPSATTWSTTVTVQAAPPEATSGAPAAPGPAPAVAQAEPQAVPIAPPATANVACAATAPAAYGSALASLKHLSATALDNRARLFGPDVRVTPHRLFLALLNLAHQHNAAVAEAVRTGQAGSVGLGAAARAESGISAGGGVGGGGAAAPATSAAAAAGLKDVSMGRFWVAPDAWVRLEQTPATAAERQRGSASRGDGSAAEAGAAAGADVAASGGDEVGGGDGKDGGRPGNDERPSKGRRLEDQDGQGVEGSEREGMDNVSGAAAGASSARPQEHRGTAREGSMGAGAGGKGCAEGEVDGDGGCVTWDVVVILDRVCAKDSRR